MAMEEIQAKKRDGQLSRMLKSCAVVVWEIFCWEGLEVIYMPFVMYLHLERKQDCMEFSTLLFVLRFGLVLSRQTEIKSSQGIMDFAKTP